MDPADLYNTAALIIEEAKLKKKSVKSLCFSSLYRKKRVLFALVLEALKHKKILERVSKLCTDVWNKAEIQLEESLKLILLYEALEGRGINEHYKHSDLFNENKETLVEALNKVCIENPELLEKQETYLIPRYVRVNTIKTSVENVIKTFEREGYQLVDKECTELDKNEFFIDKTISNLLVFYPNVDFHKHLLYKKGHIILQDKASCLPAYILDPPEGSFIIDACAAPGNKTSHLAAIIKNKGYIHAFDLDKARLKLMNDLLKVTGASSITTHHHDFLKVRHDHPTYSKCDHILLDPSCSGSGIVSRMDKLVDTDEGEENSEIQLKRLKGLCGFQTAVLSHALSFPNVKRVVYSTCSTHEEENEIVVKKAIERFGDQFTLVQVLPSWKNRGIAEDWDEASKCIRAITESDHTNGFFVAMFQRIEGSIKQPQGGETNGNGEIKTNEGESCVSNGKTNKEFGKKKKRKHKTKENTSKEIENVDFSSNNKKRKKKSTGSRKSVTS